MGYYFLWCMPDDVEVRDIVNDQLAEGVEIGAFDVGVRINKKIIEPVQIALRPGDGVMPEMFMAPLVLRTDLLKALRQFGVDNIEDYDVVITDPTDGTQWYDYKLCNLIGVVDAIDIDASTIDSDSPPDTAILFDEIVIDDKKAKGYHMFRPLHMLSSIIVSSKLKERIESLGIFKNIEFIAPEDYA